MFYITSCCLFLSKFNIYQNNNCQRQSHRNIEIMSDITFPDLTIGFFGHGNMYTALSRGFVGAKRIKPENVYASNIRQAEAEVTLPSGMKYVNSNQEILRRCDVIFISVKPHIVPSVLEEVRECVESRHLFVSIAAGLKIKQLEQMLPASSRLVRTMPNTPCQVNCGVTVFCENAKALPEDVAVTRSLFSSVGLCEQMEERFMDAVSGVSGCGPAFAFMAIEALSDGGVKMGLPRATSYKLAAQMLMGASKMVLETGKHPGELKDGVCSPGGSTITGVHELEKAGFRNALISAVEVATKRSGELGNV